MTDRPIIPDAANIAADIAEIVLKDSYKPPSGQPPVRDILLFGSAARGEPAHDIDLLLFHSSYTLDQLGLVTVYDEHLGGLVPARNINPHKDSNPNDAILSAIGFREIPDLGHYFSNATRSFRSQLRSLVQSDGRYSGIVHINHLPPVILHPGTSLASALTQFDRVLYDHIASQSPHDRVIALMKSYGLNFLQDLDLQTMNLGLLNPDIMKECRKQAIGQCADPTFWQTVLSEGKIYDPATRLFETPVSDKYPGATQSFTP